MESVRQAAEPIPETEIRPEEEKGKKVSRIALINKLNFLNFKDDAILVNFRHARYNTIVSVPARPGPCEGENLLCTWVATADSAHIIDSYTPESFSLNDGRKMILVSGEILEVTETGIVFRLPEYSHEYGARRIKRHRCKGIRLQLFQNGIRFTGRLVDFSAVTFRIEIGEHPSQNLRWLNLQSPVNLVLTREEEILYSGQCTVIRILCHTQDQIILKPVAEAIQRFSSKKYRGQRERIVPAPVIHFEHPFTRHPVSLPVYDLSGSGLSVEEVGANSVLTAGMMIPEIELIFADNFRIACKAQVVYRNPTGTGDGTDTVRCGLAFLDMDIADHARLLSLVYQIDERNSYVSSKVDDNTLWEFFFETGFIYPQKYQVMSLSKDQFKELYRKLYDRSPSIARHFIYQEKGTLLGHMAMVRFYDKSWLVHHHAAKKSENLRAGVVVLKQASRSLNDSYKLFSSHMDFVICYYRPDNKFPNRVFGGFSSFLQDTRGCSIDTFAYLHYRPASTIRWDLEEAWELAKSAPPDLQELESFYNHVSGGLMMPALNLSPRTAPHSTITALYQQLGFKRETHFFSLKKEGKLVALFMINVADLGLNLSDLTNCIKVFILDDEEVPKETLDAVLFILTVKFKMPQPPVLIYPCDYAAKQGIPYEKKYNLWVLNIDFLEQYYQFCEKLLGHK